MKILDYNVLRGSVYSAPDHHSLKTHTPKTLSKYYENIEYFVRFAWAIACHRLQSIFNNITRHAIAVLGEFQGKTKKAGDPAQDRSHLPRSHILSKRQRDVVTFPKHFYFQHPVFHEGRSMSWLMLRISNLSGLLKCRTDMATKNLALLWASAPCVSIAKRLGFE